MSSFDSDCRLFGTRISDNFQCLGKGWSLQRSATKAALTRRQVLASQEAHGTALSSPQGGVCCPKLSPSISKVTEGMRDSSSCSPAVRDSLLEHSAPTCLSAFTQLLVSAQIQLSGSSWCLLLTTGRALPCRAQALPAAPFQTSLSCFSLHCDQHGPLRQTEPGPGHSLHLPLQGQGMASSCRFQLHDICKMQFSYRLSH